MACLKTPLRRDAILDFTAIESLVAGYPKLHNLLVGYSGGVDSHVLLHLLGPLYIY